jgi:uncharacterized protein DUF5681
MSTRKDNKRSSKGGQKPRRRPEQSTAGTYAIGYGKPPRAHQFKPGQSGHGEGRPPGSKNEATIIKEILGKTIKIREGDKIRRITVLEAMFRRFAEKSVAGDIKSATFLLNRFNSVISAVNPGGLDHDDQALLQEFLEELETEITAKKRVP